MNDELSRLEEQKANLEMENSVFTAKPEPKPPVMLGRELCDILELLCETDGGLTAAQIAFHFGTNRSTADDQIALLVGQNLIGSYPSLPNRDSEVEWRILPHGTTVLLNVSGSL